ncbi:MAG TPA: hypothetical protein ENN36_04495 [Candidatus Bathyarchaeota archaeon]|nr:hypothetical protein [Candidatus Bathyarchaeota archaeon]
MSDDVQEECSSLNHLKVNPNLLETYMKHLDKTVKKDHATKRMVFLTALSAYSQNPQNLFLKGPSSTGKTYNVTQALTYFPQSFIWMLGGLSPTALVHDYGILIDNETGKEIDPIEDKPQKEDYKDNKGKFDKKAFQAAQKRWRDRLRKAYYLVNLQGKILVFLEAPNPETYMRLRPVLSHDAPQISYKFTDKPGGGALRTMHVVLKGWPACIFCTTETKYIEDLATRGFTITPDLSQEKIKAAIQLIGERKAYPWKYDPKHDQTFKKLQEYMDVLTGRLCIINSVVIPYSHELSKIYPSTIYRDMRDYNHFTALIELNCLLNIFQRPYIVINKNTYWMANTHDYLTALELLKSFEETTRAGIPGHIVTFYHKIIVPFQKPVNYEDLVEKHNETMSEKLSKKRIYKYVELLRDIGWVDTIQDPEDKRRRLVYPLKKAESRLYHSLRKSTPFFHQKNFENWLKMLENYSSPENIFIYNNLVDKEKHALNSSSDLTKYFIEKLFREEYFLEPLEPKQDPKTENNAEIIGGEEKLQNSTLSQLQSDLKEKFSWGTQQDFEKIAKQLDPNLSQSEAESLFEKLVDQGHIAMDPQGWWRWTQ